MGPLAIGWFFVKLVLAVVRLNRFYILVGRWFSNWIGPMYVNNLFYKSLVFHVSTVSLYGRHFP